MKRPFIVASLAVALIAPGAASAGTEQARPRATGSSHQGSSAASAPARSGGQQSAGPRVAVPRSGSQSGRSLPPRTAVSRDGGASRQPSAGTRVSAPSRGGEASAVPVTSSRLAVDRYSRPRNGRYPTGTAVPRGTVGPIRPPHGHPGWYWNNYYWYPYGFGAWGIGWYFYDPWWWGAPGPYYSPYYSPYYYPYGYGYGYGDFETGAVRLKVSPRDAQVFVDGGYVGIVDEFDGTFQRLHLDTGQHRIEIRKEGFEPLIFDVNVTIGHTITLRGDLRPARPLNDTEQ